jgi:hypothetical protein
LSKLPTNNAIAGASSIVPNVLPHTGQKARFE